MITRRSESLFRGSLARDEAQFVDQAALKVSGDKERHGCCLLHRRVEGDKLATRLGIAVLILDQDPADRVTLNHLVEVAIKRRAVKFYYDHLPQLLIQGHILYNSRRQFAVAQGSRRWQR